MLIRFNVANFLSFNKQVEFALIANQERRLPTHYIKGDGLNILKSAVVYGANASGKSNLVKAIDFSRRLIVNGLESLNPINCHFRLEEDNVKIPSIFNFEVAIKNKYYSYGFAVILNKPQIIEEWLFEIGKEKQKKIFERVLNEKGEHEISFGLKLENSEKKRFEVYQQDFKNSNTLLFLSEMNRKNMDNLSEGFVFQEVYNWFKDKLTVLFPDSRFKGLNFVGSDEEMAQTFNNFLDVFQTGISSITSKEISLDNFDIPDPIKKDISKRAEKTKQLIFQINGEAFSLKKDDRDEFKIIKIGLNHLNEKMEIVVFDMEDESDGTRRLFDFIPALHQLANSESVFVIDELDRSLHSKLTLTLFELFQELSLKNRSQLIATTHEALLLDLDLFRKDEIWFVEKNNNESRLYSLNEFKIRNDKIINKDYLLGRYGAIPIFKSFKNLS